MLTHLLPLTLANVSDTKQKCLSPPSVFIYQTASTSLQHKTCSLYGTYFDFISHHWFIKLYHGKMFLVKKVWFFTLSYIVSDNVVLNQLAMIQLESSFYLIHTQSSSLSKAFTVLMVYQIAGTA